MAAMIYIVIVLYVLWLFYLAVMNLYRAKKANQISAVALWLGYPILVMGALLDLLVNMLLMTLIFAEWPRELLVTKRLERHVKTNQGWRSKLAYWICHNLLNAFDPSGDHCD
jgi:hypothetical protein